MTDPASPAAVTVQDWRERALAAEARLAQANEALKAGPFTLHRQGDDCMSPGGCRFSIFDGEGNVWAMFDTLPVDDRRKAQSIVGALNATPTPPAQSAGEALDPAGTGEGVNGADDDVRLAALDDDILRAKAYERVYVSVEVDLVEKLRAQASALAEARAEQERWEAVAEQAWKAGNAIGASNIKTSFNNIELRAQLKEARRSALEEAAKVCDRFNGYMAQLAAKAIRALTEPQHGNG